MAENEQHIVGARWYAPWILSLAFMVILGFFLSLVREETNRERRDSLRRDLQTTTRDVEFRLRGIAEYLELVAEDYSGGKTDRRAFNRRGKKYMASHPEIIGMMLLNESGEAVWAVSALPGSGLARDMKMPQPHEAFRRAKKPGVAEFSAIFPTMGGDSALTIVIPATGDAKFAAQVSVSILLRECARPWIVEKYYVSLRSPDKSVSVRRTDPDTDPALHSRLALSGPVSFLSVDLAAYRSGPDWRILSLGILSLCLATGMGIAMWLLGKDNYRRRKIEGSLQAINRARSELVANISHEIRTPLGAIKGFADLLGDPSQTTYERLNCIRAISRNTNNLLDLINDLLDMSKIDAGLLELDSVEFSLTREISEIVGLFRKQASEKGLDLTVEYGDPIPETITTDPKRLRQVLINIIGNAVKFTESGSVGIRVFMDPVPGVNGRPMLCFHVADSGIGISSDDQVRLFQSFSQADSSIRRRFGGTGLGLVLSRRLARAMDGETELLESAPGKGSTFAVTIDPGDLAGVNLLVGLRHADLKDTVWQPALTPTVSLKGVRTLIVEDSRDNQVIYSRYLELAGGDVELAGNGIEGVEKAAAGEYDIILMDIQMPDMDGYEATRTVRQTDKETPIIALTAHAMKGERERCLGAGCNEYLTKPVEADTLVQLIAWYADRAAEKPISMDGVEVSAAARLSASESRGQRPGISGGTEDLQHRLAEGPLKSLFHDDPRVAPVLPPFVQGLSDRIAEFTAAVESGDLPKVGRLAHTLKGTASNYGYPELADIAILIESRVKKDNRDDMVLTDLQSLREVCGRIQSFFENGMTRGQT